MLNNTASGLSDTMRAAIEAASQDGTLTCSRGTADALIRRGLAEATYGTVYRTNRYSRTRQRVYNARTGARLVRGGES